jgi:hypothetical protein
MILSILQISIIFLFKYNNYKYYYLRVIVRYNIDGCSIANNCPLKPGAVGFNQKLDLGPFGPIISKIGHNQVCGILKNNLQIKIRKNKFAFAGIPTENSHKGSRRQQRNIHRLCAA